MTIRLMRRGAVAGWTARGGAELGRGVRRDSRHRRSREMTYLRADRVTHPENAICHRATLAPVGSSTPKACKPFSTFNTTPVAILLCELSSICRKAKTVHAPGSMGHSW